MYLNVTESNAPYLAIILMLLIALVMVYINISFKINDPDFTKKISSFKSLLTIIQALVASFVSFVLPIYYIFLVFTLNFDSNFPSNLRYINSLQFFAIIFYFPLLLLSIYISKLIEKSAENRKSYQLYKISAYILLVPFLDLIIIIINLSIILTVSHDKFG